VKNVGVGGRCGETGRESMCTGVGKDAGVGLGGGGNRVGNGGGTSCYRFGGDPASRPAPTTLPVSGRRGWAWALSLGEEVFSQGGLAAN
jgi:hypothetical protein